MEDKKYQIFISSTYVDLIPARSKISETILNLYHFPVGMEMFSAGDSEQWEIISETIAVSDYYVLIIGHRYGSMTEDGISYTEKEFDYAKSIGVPIMAFIRNRSVATTAAERDSDAGLTAKLDAFIEKAKTGRVCEFWETSDDLATKVAVALPKTFKRLPRTGWVRQSEVNLVDTLSELSRLSIENRELRAKLEGYERLENEAAPKFEVKLNALAAINLKYATHHSDLHMSPPVRIGLEDIDPRLASYVTAEDVDLYNSSLPDAATYEKYLESLLRYRNIKDSSVALDIEIFNVGSVKAGEVYVSLEFPNFVVVSDDIDLSKIKEPVSPVPEHPGEYARKRLRQSMRFGGVADLIRAPSISGFVDLAPLSVPVPPGLNKRMTVDDNFIDIYMRGLMHTRSETFGGKKLLLSPVSKGEGVVFIRVICEQFKSQHVIEVPIVVD